jgi:hypothetical protein
VFVTVNHVFPSLIFAHLQNWPANIRLGRKHCTLLRNGIYVKCLKLLNGPLIEDIVVCQQFVRRMKSQSATKEIDNLNSWDKLNVHLDKNLSLDPHKHGRTVKCL